MIQTTWMRINKMDLKKQASRAWHGFNYLVICFCEHTNDHLSSIIYGEFLD